MHEETTTKLRASVEELEKIFETASRQIYHPTLLVHPPSARNTHDGLLCTQVAALGALRGVVSELADRLLAVCKGLFLLEKSCQAARASIHALPDETLHSILTLSRPTHYEWTHVRTTVERKTRDLVAYRFNMSLVCRKWYSIVVSHGLLWEATMIPHHSMVLDTPLYTEAPRVPLSLLLTRSISRRLHAPTAQALLGRLRNLAIECDHSNIYRVMELFDRARGPPLYHLTFPVLESLNIYHARRMNSPSHNTLAFSRLVNFPSLKSLSLDGVAPEGTLEAPVLQHLFMDGQERLELDFTFGEFLKTCTSLQTLELNGFGAWSFLPFMGPITLPSLVALTLKRASKKYVTRIASFLRVPRLDSLSILDWNFDLDLSTNSEVDSWYLLERNDAPTSALLPEGRVCDFASLMLAMRSMFSFMPTITKVAVGASEAISYAILAPILPLAHMPPLGTAVRAIDIRLVENCEEEDLHALAGFVRDIVLRRHAMGSDIRVEALRCLEAALDVGGLPPNSMAGWYEECVCGSCDS